jgi:hypothetical protein
LARENIRFEEGNFTGDGTYFYSILDGAQVLQQKVDDGTVAFSYPLDTAVAGNINGLEWDGVYFWSVENRSGGDGITIRKWGIESFVCKQQQKFELIDGPTHTYNVNSIAIEHYRLSVGVNLNGNDYTYNQTSVAISDTSMLEPGDVLTFVRRFTSAAQRVGTPFVEQVTVQSVSSPTVVALTSAMQGTPHGGVAHGGPFDADKARGFRGPDVDVDSLTGDHPPTPDDVFVTKFIWLANDDSPSNPGTPSLYKLRASNGSNVIQFSGTQYNDVNALTFYAKYDIMYGLDQTSGGGSPIPEVPAVLGGNTPYHTTVVTDSDAGGRQTYLLVARASSLLFFNTDTNLIDRSMVMNNVKVNTIDHWNVDDMLVVGVEPDIILYRLQQGTTAKNASLVLTDYSWSTFNYEKQLLRRVASSISVSVFPSIIPADGASTAVASATVRDQYNDTVAGIQVDWADDAGGADRLTPDNSQTDAFGVARSTYQAGDTEQDVKITASITNGLV